MLYHTQAHLTPHMAHGGKVGEREDQRRDETTADAIDVKGGFRGEVPAGCVAPSGAHADILHAVIDSQQAVTKDPSRAERGILGASGAGVVKRKVCIYIKWRRLIPTSVNLGDHCLFPRGCHRSPPRVAITH